MIKKELFNKVVIKSTQVCIYHSKDLDGFMSRYLAQNYWLDSDTKFIGYNYESDSEWMHENYKEYIFIDVTPPIEWLKKHIDKSIIIFDHHKNTIQNIIESLGLQELQRKKEYKRFDNPGKHNLNIFIPTDDTVSACKLLYLYLSNYNDITILKNYVNYISTYDTWSFVDEFENVKDELLNIIETLKVLNYDEFEHLLNSINHNSYKEIKNKLILTGNFLRIKSDNESNRMLDRALYHLYNGKKSIQLIIGDKYPDYELETIIREKFENKIPIIYISYSVDLQNNKATFSVRHYPINNIESHINALEIAKAFDGGGHPNAAGFSLTLSEFNALLKDKFQAIKNLINYKK